MAKRFFYSTETNKIYFCDNDHASHYHNAKGKTLFLNFDDYIRGIIKEDILYLRVFYPYDDIQDLTFEALIEKSNALLSLYKRPIFDALEAQGVTIERIVLSCTNEALKEALNTLYV